MSDQKDDEKWTFHSPHENEEVWDPATNKPLCAFKDHKFETSDKALAKRLKAQGYEEWVVFTADDEVELLNGEKIRIGDLPKAIAQEFIGKPKKVAQDLLGLIKSPFGKKEEDPDNENSGDSEDGPPPANQCPICKRVFDSPSALNGHFAHCKAKDEQENEEE